MSVILSFTIFVCCLLSLYKDVVYTVSHNDKTKTTDCVNLCGDVGTLECIKFVLKSPRHACVY